MDPDELIVFAEDYVDKWQMFDRITDIGYLVRDKNDESFGTRLDFVWRRNLNKWMEDRKPEFVEVVDKLIIARVRLNWNTVSTEWLASEDEYQEFVDDWEILEIYIKAYRKDEPEEAARYLLTPEDRRVFEANPDEWVVVDRKYLAAFKISPETREELLKL